MTQTLTDTQSTGFGAASVLAWCGDMLERMGKAAERTPRARAINALHAMTDAELTAKGTTRMDEVRRIVGPGYYL